MRSVAQKLLKTGSNFKIIEKILKIIEKMLNMNSRSLKTKKWAFIKNIHQELSRKS